MCHSLSVRERADLGEGGRRLCRRLSLSLALWLALGLWGGVPGRLAAELLPAEVGVLASDKGRESAQLARYYMQARGIPAENLLLLDVPAGENLSRELWDRRVRPAIRKWLLSRERSRQIRCLVTVYDVPLRINAVTKDAASFKESEQFLESAIQKCRVETIATAAALERVMNDEPAVLSGPEADAPIGDLAKFLDGPLQRALARVQERSRKEPNSRAVASALRQLEMLHMVGVGVSGSLRQLESQTPAGPAQQTERARLMANRQGEMMGLKLGVTALSFQPESVTREMQLLELITRADGLLVALSWATQQLEVVRRNESQASFDSELALVLWPDHGLVRWLPNPLHWSSSRLPAARPDTLMVARLDGSTPEIVRRLVDDALAIEQAGLTGKVYLDARKETDAKPPARNGSYGEYEAALNQLARYLKEKTQLEVVLDTSKELFAEGACPDAALYCGWYSLGNYRDSFTWRKGAVGYHIASGEASTFRKPESRAWCKKMLDNGVSATLGPTFEPYLAAFPRPDDFFPLLLTGRLTLAEVYSATLPFHSWAMTLVGDPLYTPYRTNPALSVTDLPLRLQSVIGPPGVAPPLPENPDAPAN
jgi:uncharacterized protein (TIGR03790 family)